MDIFRKYNLKVEPWETDYNTSIQLDEQEQPKVEVNPDIEIIRDKWKPLATGAENCFAGLNIPLTFLDGVRRMDLRLMAVNSDAFFYGGIGTIGAGAVTIRSKQQADFSEVLCKGSGAFKYCITCNLPEAEDSISIKSSGETIPWFNVPENKMDMPPIKLQALMREKEVELADKLSENLEGIMILDGPLLRGFPDKKIPIVGYVKTFKTLYISNGLIKTLLDLKAKERTPLFTIDNDKYSCFIRLAVGRPGDLPLSGLVRIEMSTKYHLAKAIEIADLMAGVLPDLSTSKNKDPRAPQNLIPMQSLENYLRRLMGNKLLVRRQLETELFNNWKNPMEAI